MSPFKVVQFCIYLSPFRILTANVESPSYGYRVYGSEDSVLLLCRSLTLYSILRVSVCVHHAAKIKSLFNERVFYSEDGTNRKAKEMTTYMFFCDYLEDCTGVFA